MQPREYDLWPEWQPAAVSPRLASITEERIERVQRATLTAFVPPHPKAAVVVCPGGGYRRLEIIKEGWALARWLARQGVAAFVLKYRVGELGHPAPLQDALRAIRFVRMKAADFRLKSSRVGVMGSSAGGHLAACASTLHGSKAGRTGAAWDVVAARPDFQILLYPVITMQGPAVHQPSRRALLGARPSSALRALVSPDVNVDPSTPPAFIVHGADDQTVPVENSLAYHRALTRAGVAAELHVFAHAPHGFALTMTTGAVRHWPKSCAIWLREILG